MKKICYRCEVEKPIEEFYRNKTSIGGRRRICKKCVEEDKKGYYSQPAVKKHVHEYQKKYYSIKKEKYENLRCLRTYGITFEQKKQIWEKQQRKCQICRQKIDMGKNCHLDHDHKTGKIRGILCQNCNHGVYFVENSLWIDQAKQYLNT